MRVPVPLAGLLAAVGAFVLAAGTLSLLSSALAQDVRGEVARAVDELRKTNQSLAVEVDRSTGLPTSIKGLTPRPDPSIALGATRSLSGEPSEEDVRRAVEAFMATSQIRSAFPQVNAQERKVVTQVRRDPDIKWNRAATDLRKFARAQQRMIRHAADVVCPGGALLYATCSSEPEENADVVHHFLRERTDFAIDPIVLPAGLVNDPDSALVDANGFLATRPDRHQLDAYFAARLVRLVRRNPA